MNNTIIEEHINTIIEQLHENNTHYLHKPCAYGTPDADAEKFVLPEDYFIMSDTQRISELCRVLPNCCGSHNGRVVLDYNDYFVGITPIDLAARFVMPKTIRRSTVLNPVRGNDRDGLIKDLYNFARVCNELIKRKIGLDIQYRPKYIFFNKIESPNTENEIIKRIRKYYNDDIKGIDLRTNTPLAESFFILVGWLFSPVDPKQRLVGCFECKTSQIGKTAFIKHLCDKVDVVFGTMSQVNGSANQFSFSSCFAQGPDIVNVDDPCKGTTDIMQYVGNVVSNKEAPIELKGEDRYMLRDLETRIYVSTNVPIYIKNDTTNFMTTKLFVLKANDTLPDEGRSSKICEYIDGCSKEVVEEFISYCVDQYALHGEEFIKTHMGIFIDKEEEENLFNDMLDYDKIRNAVIGKTTLIECVRGDMCHDEDNRNREHNELVLKCWNMLTKHIQTRWVELAGKTVCTVPRVNDVYPVGNRPPKNRYKNYVITKEVQDRLLEHVAPDVEPPFDDVAHDSVALKYVDDSICGSETQSSNTDFDI